jgi:predicted MPP superfamily phosphohydrolase
MLYTLGQAAKATGKSKPTIQRAIKSGQLSAKRNDNGSYTIDPAELHRVFQPVTAKSNATGTVKQSETPEIQGENQLLRELLKQVEGERDDLRRRLDASEAAREAAAAETRRLTLLLTHQPASSPAATPNEAKQPRPSFWRRLTGKG